MGHERDDPRRRRSRLSPAGQELLVELERAAEAFEPPPEETLFRVGSLPSSEREEVAAIFGTMAREFAEHQRENMQNAAFAATAADAIREAQERDRAAGRGVDPNTKLGDALGILGR